MSFKGIPSLQSASADACRSSDQGQLQSSDHVTKEQQCVLHWFQGWSAYQKEDFLKFLLDRAVPQNMDCLFHAMDNMNVKDKPFSVFRCQLKLLGAWLTDWTDEEKNTFMFNLGTNDPVFVARFREEVSKVT